MFLTKILTNINPKRLIKTLDKPSIKIFGVNGHSLYIFILSILSGYPTGSKLVSELFNQKKLPETQLYKTALLCSTSGPIFIIGTVGVYMLKNFKLGVLLYAINIISSIISILILNQSFKIKKTRQNCKISSSTDNNCEKKHETMLKIITNSANETSKGLLIVAFYITFFYMFIDLLTQFKIISLLANGLNLLNLNRSTSTGLLSGIIEMTRGIQLLSLSINPLHLSLISFLLSFGGFSIIFQSLSFLNDTPLANKNFIAGKLLQGLISFTISILLFNLI